jgi:hypothetical protein
VLGVKTINIMSWFDVVSAGTKFAPSLPVFVRAVIEAQSYRLSFETVEKEGPAS